MDQRNRSPTFKLLVSTRFLCTLGAGLVLSLVIGLVAEPWLWCVVLATLLCSVIGLLAELLIDQPGHSSNGLLETPFLLAHDRDVFDRYRSLTRNLLRVSQKSDAIYREIALERLTSLADEAEQLGGGTIVFDGTETWRIAYEKLLRSPGLHLYRSVAWVRHADYWQDEPGRQSMQLNLELHESETINIERIVIIADALWPKEEEFPVEPVRQWIHEQHAAAIWIRLVRESALKNERDLVSDSGIYGSRAVGFQELNEHCQTSRFVLTFDFESVTQAEDRWKRLAVYATSYAELLDRVRLDA